MIDKVRIGIPKYQVYDLLEFIIGALGFAASILQVVQFFTKPIFPALAVTFVFCSSLSAVFLIKMLKFRKLSQNRLDEFSSSINKYAGIIRDESYALDRLYDTQQLTSLQLLDHARSTGQQGVDLLERILTFSTGERINVCIKYFPDIRPRDAGYTKPEDLYVKTLCRSAGTSTDRESDALARVSENTDFLQIIKEDRNYFRARDLHERDRQLRESGAGPYRNSTPNWDEMYRATIVVPIRIKRRLLGQDAGVQGYDLLGFWCADTLSTCAFRDSDMAAYTCLVKAFADLYYIYFNKVHQYLQKIEDNNGD